MTFFLTHFNKTFNLNLSNILKMNNNIIVIIFCVCLAFPSSSFCETNKTQLVLEEIKLLGEFSKPKKYPDGMLEFFGTACTNFSCRVNKSTKKMTSTFKRSKSYHQRNPGHQLYALAMFELFYLNQLKEKEKKIEKFISSWPEKNKHGKTIVSLIKLNKSREKMRKSLGMDLNTSVEESMERYWIMGDFLGRGEIKKEKLSKEIKKREKLLIKYKQAVNRFNAKLKNQKDEDLYNDIKKK